MRFQRFHRKLILHFIFKVVQKLVEDDIKAGVVKPLKTNVFEASEVEQAFRFMASGKHIGKVLLKIRENATDLKSLPISVLPRNRSEERRVGKECCSWCRSRWSPYH